jgi:hypothetical protein
MNIKIAKSNYYLVLILIITFFLSCKDNSVNNNGNPINYAFDDDIIVTKFKLNDTIMRIYGIKLSDMKLRYITNIGFCFSKCYVGKIILANFSQYCLSPAYIFNLKTGSYSLIPVSNYYPYYYALSPDASKVLFTTDAGNYLIVLNVDGTGMREISQDIRGTETLAEFSRDGSKIAFIEKNQNYKSVIYTIDTSGNNKNVVLDIEEPDNSDRLSWSPDNKTIVFSNKNSSFKYNICKVNINGTGYTNLTNSNNHQLRPEFSPDGLYIVFEDLGSTGIKDIIVMNPDGSNQVNITNTASVNEFFSSWSPDGKKILYSKSLEYGGLNNCYIYDINTKSTIVIDSVLNALWVYSK